MKDYDKYQVGDVVWLKAEFPGSDGVNRSAEIKGKGLYVLFAQLLNSGKRVAVLPSDILAKFEVR